ncbi:MAG: helix-turn-helix transcriptional regulator [Chloroflexi bacterium]|nr:helix-turn-helix transcriptional regulator [Chloroflexota bacterium]
MLLFIAERPSHGYDLLERFRRLGVPAADPGGLYRALRQMEREELVSSRWETSLAGPARRTYTLTDGGWQWLHLWAAAIAEGRLVLSSYLDRYDALTATDPRGESPSDPPTAALAKGGAALARRAR